MLRISNREELLDPRKSSLRARKIALNVVESVLKSVDPRSIVESEVVLDGSLLRVKGCSVDLDSFERVFVVGGGKASGAMAEAVVQLLGDRINKGLVVVPRGTVKQRFIGRIELHEASHPVPDENSVAGARKLLDLALEAEDKDLVLGFFSGGGSSLMASPLEGLSLGDKQRVTELLLRSGACISEINTVRKHLSGFKGGWLAKACFPARVISLLLSDVVGDDVGVIASGPTAPDSTTFEDAIEVLRRYSLWELVPSSVKEVLFNGEKGEIPETPKASDPVFEEVSNIVIGNNGLACASAVDELRRHGLQTVFLSSYVEGQAKDLGLMLGATAIEMVSSGNPVATPAGIVLGGETTVTVTGEGKGGRNQEIALGAALKLNGLNNTVLVSFSTDGVDGPTDAAGALADGSTVQRGRERGMDAKAFLKENDSYSFFSRLGDLVLTGPTGTNVNDLSILVVL
jgi:glycerate-2-kinase